MAEPTFRTVPILRIFNVAKAKEFYVDFLGLQVDWEHRFEPGAPVDMQVSRGDVLHLSEHHGDCSPGGCVCVKTTGLHREMTAKATASCAPASSPLPGAQSS